jgi:hypothetical protein
MKYNNNDDLGPSSADYSVFLRSYIGEAGPIIEGSVTVSQSENPRFLNIQSFCTNIINFVMTHLSLEIL